MELVLPGDEMGWEDGRVQWTGKDEETSCHSPSEGTIQAFLIKKTCHLSNMIFRTTGRSWQSPSRSLYMNIWQIITAFPF